MRCAVGEVHMKMVDPVPREKIREIKGVARALLGLDAPAVFLLVPIDERARPCAGCFRILLPDPQDCLRWRIVNGRT